MDCTSVAGNFICQVCLLIPFMQRLYFKRMKVILAATTEAACQIFILSVYPYALVVFHDPDCSCVTLSRFAALYLGCKEIVSVCECLFILHCFLEFLFDIKT